jgi:hypothetical protein
MTEDKKTIFNLPISGGGFPCQLGLMAELLDALSVVENFEKRPDISFAASGGNVAVYITMAGDWTSDGIYRVSSDLKPEMFTRSWFPKGMKFMPTALIGIFKGSLYRDGFGAEDLFSRYLTESSIQRSEIWTMTFNMGPFKTEMFSNKKQSECLIQPEIYSKSAFTYDSLDLNYVKTDGAMEKMSIVSHASASIPYLVEGKKIDSQTNADGGVMYSSPSIPLKYSIESIIKGQKDDLRPSEFIIDKNGDIIESTATEPKMMRYFYFEPYSYDSKYPMESNVASTKAMFLQLFHSRMILDRRVGLDILMDLEGDINHTYYPLLNTKTLSNIILWLEEYAKHYYVSLSPNFRQKVSMTSFTPLNIKNLIDKTRKKYSANVWYIKK